MLIELMHKLICILLLEIVVELFLIFCIYQVLVFFPQSPLLLRRKLLYTWEAPRLVSVILSKILIGSQLHLKVKPTLIRLAKVMSLWDQVLELRRITSVVKVDHTRRIVALAGLSSLQHLVEKRWTVTFGVHWFAPHWLIGFFDVCVECSASELGGFLELFLEIFTLFDMLAEFGVPFLDIIIVKTWRIRNGI